MNTPIENLRLPRTGKSTLYEVMSAAILLLAWIAGIVATINHKTSWKNSYPTHCFLCYCGINALLLVSPDDALGSQQLPAHNRAAS